jgi:hypothetical protein
MPDDAVPTQIVGRPIRHEAQALAEAVELLVDIDMPRRAIFLEHGSSDR